MINIDNLEKFVVEELSSGEGFSVRMEGWIELISRLRQAERDAARWRKLIEMNDDINCELAVCTWHGGYEYSMVPDINELIDAHIDEAMNGSNN